ncbi:MAG: glycosyltransferase family 4 protein [Desulfococcaceae bacterium]
MKVAFYTPFKPLDHPNPSGDLATALGLRDLLTELGHRVIPVGPLRSRWIYWRPQKWLRLPIHLARAGRRARDADVWLTCHAYYKAPDLLGPAISRRLGIPYAIFQGIYSTKRRRRLRTWPGFHLNRWGLSRADCVFSNRTLDLENLRRLLPDERLAYVPPGIVPEDFDFDPEARERFRRSWGAGDRPVMVSAAMFRADVKSQGLAWTIRSAGRLRRAGLDFHLAIAGDGRERERLTRLAEAEAPGRVHFVGKIRRDRMGEFYSAGDLFVFPGIRETLGMVFLEAQARGIPVVAFRNGGIPEVVADGKTGLLTPPFDADVFDEAVRSLLTQSERRDRMGNAARDRVRRRHDIRRNYGAVAERLEALVRRRRKSG